MHDIARSAAAIGPPRAPQVEFYSVELALLSNGLLYVSLTATVADNAEEPRLFDQSIVAQHVATIDDALALVKARVQIS